MKKLLLSAFMVALTGIMFARPVTQQRAQQIGEQFLSTTSLQRAEISLQLVYSPATRGTTDYYVFNVRGEKGFVVVSGDDSVKPILAYSTTGSFNSNDIADGFAYMLSGYSEEIQYVREHNIAATPDIIAEWESVANNDGIRKGNAARSVVGPLCQSIWNQNFPWNSQCPEDESGNGGHVYAGCVATAMGQVMKFYDYPARGTGSYSYNPSGYPTQTANFGDTDYHFELMPYSLDSTSTEEEYFYIAQFLHHVGISVDMQYSGSGSGAYSESVPTALRSFFGYTCDENITNYNYWGWGGYSNEEWIVMLKNGGIDEGIPLYYSGSDDNGNGGHAFVCDGYDENDYFHFNWGWSGRDDAWCAIGALNTTRYAFNTFNGFVGHIVPQNSNYFNRPEGISNFNLTENDEMNGTIISWTNPANDLNGNAITTIESATIRRNNVVIATLTNLEPGAEMSYSDIIREDGLYEYSVFITNEAGVSRSTYSSILVGEKCDMVFNLNDSGNDGWKGAAISVADENGNRIAVITLGEGSEQTITLPLLKQNLNFVWNHGWYHNYPEYDTDEQCSFSIEDADGNVLFTSDALQDGVFLSYYNDCENNVGVNETVNNDYKIYPNPTNGIVKIEGDGAMRIKVLNTLGQTIFEGEAQDNAQIDLSNCESGIYIIHIESDNSTSTKTIISY